MAKPSESTPSRLKGQPGPPFDPGVRRGGPSGPQPGPTRGGAPEAGWDPKLRFPQEGSRVGISTGGGGEGATNTVGAARGSAGRRRAGRQSAPESGSRGEPGRAGESRGEPGGRGRVGKAGRRRREPRASRRGRAGGALGARHGDARLPLVRRARPGMRGGGGCSCRRLRGAVAVPLQATAAQQPVPGSGPWGGSRRGPARLLWLLRVTGRAGPGEGVYACAKAAEGQKQERRRLLGRGEG